MKFELFIASRYLKTRKANNFISRISVIAVGLITLAVIIPMVTMSVMNGFHESVKAKHINKDYHVQIKRYGLTNPDKLIDRLLKIPKLKEEVVAIVPFYRGQAQMQYGFSRYFGVMVRGIRKDFYTKDLSLKKHFPLIAGSYDFKKKFRVVIGDKLVRQMNPDRKDYLNFIKSIRAGKGKTINVLVFSHWGGDEDEDEDESQDNRIKIFKLKVGGVFKSGYLEYDKFFTFTDLSTAQTIYNARYEGSATDEKIVTGIGIKLHNRERADYVVNLIQDRYADINANTWKTFNKRLLFAFEWEKCIMVIILALMIVASVIITIYINLNIIVMDKKKEIGILKSFGVRNRTIRTIFILEGFLIGVIGTVLGGILSMLLIVSLLDIILFAETTANSVMGYFYKLYYGSAQEFIPWEFLSGGLGHLKLMLYQIDYSDLFLLCVLPIFVSMFAAYFPARKSTKENITTVLRYE